MSLNKRFSATGATEKATIEVKLELPGERTDGGATTAQGRLSGTFSPSRVLETSQSGLLSDVFLDVTEVVDQNLFQVQRIIEIDDTIVTPEFLVPVDEPVELTVQLNAEARHSSRFLGGFGRSTADFQRTLAFPTDRPVFDLPPGVTVDSAQAGIVNNRFGTPAQATPIPEPSSMALLGIGAVSLFGYGWRRKRSGAKA